MNRSITAIALIITLVSNAHGQISSSTTRKSEPKSEPKPKSTQSIDELLLFFPVKHPSGDWAPKDLDFKDVDFTSADKTKLHAWYCPCDNPRAVILLSHGNAGNLAGHASWLRYLQKQARVSVMIYDYRGFGRSEGKPTVEGVLQDATAARAKLCQLASVKDSELLLMGESLGGAIAVQLAAKSAPRGLILQSTFSSLKDVATVHYPKLAWLVPANKLNSAAAISQYHGPILQSHGDKDEIVPFHSGEKLFQAANEPKDLLTISNAGHNNWMCKDYLTRFDEFLERVKPVEKR